MAGWSSIKSTPFEHVVSELAPIGLAAIGRYAYGISGNNVYVYDSVLDTWSIKTTTPAGSNILAAVAINDKIYCFNYPIKNGLYVYTPITNAWELRRGTDLPAAYIRQYNFVSVREKIYYFQSASFSPQSDNIIIYDTESDQWSSFAPIQSVRRQYGIAAAGDKIYVIGGNTYMSAAVDRDVDSSILESLDTDSKTWSVLSSMILGKRIFATTISGSEIYAIAGYSGNTIHLSDTQIYNIQTDSWRLGMAAPFSGATMRHIAVCNGIILIVGSLGYCTLDTRTASIVNPIPSSGFVNEKTVNAFTWTLESSPAGTAQQSATFQWRVRNSTTINTINVGSAQSVTIPANTLPNGEIEWRVSATNAAGITAPFTEWFLLTTIDERPNKPTGLYPNTGSRDGTRTIQFSWLHNSPLSTPQSAFELQITYDGGYSWKAISGKVTTAATQFTAAANTITPTDVTGRVGWRVRTYNSDNIASEWSDTAFFIVHPAPQAPNWVSVESGRARPLCRWTSLGQVGFQLQVTSGDTVLFDSGEIPGTATEYRILEYLSNGIFTFQVRIKNIRGLFSEWAVRTVTINAPHRLSITLQGEAVENAAHLTFDAEVRTSG